jgi:hypothetical protein
MHALLGRYDGARVRTPERPMDVCRHSIAANADFVSRLPVTTDRKLSVIVFFFGSEDLFLTGVVPISRRLVTEP